MTLEEYKSLVKNRPEPDTPGFYGLGVLNSYSFEAQKGKYSTDVINASTKECRKGVASYKVWRYASSYCTLEYYATFEEAYQAMHTFKERARTPFVITGYVISRFGFGPSKSNSKSVSYRTYDAQCREICHSVHSLYHEGTPGIYGKFLGRFPEDIRFNPGDIVEVPVKHWSDNFKGHALGIVVKSPMTVEQMYRPYFNVDDDYPDEIGTDCYTICFAPSDSHSGWSCRSIPADKVRTPAFEVPEEARKCLMQYRDTLKATVDENCNNPRVDVELVVVGEPVELVPVQVQLTDSVKSYNWIESGKNAAGATIYRCSFRESAKAVNELIQKLKEQHPNHEVRFRATHELSYAFEVFTDDHKGEYFPEHSCYSFFMYIIESNIIEFANNRQAAVDEINAYIREHHIKADNGEDFHILSPDDIEEAKVIRVNSFSEIHWTAERRGTL
jgi:hypothetical protein